MLRAQAITVQYGNCTVVHEVSFDVHAGEWWMLIGPNGAGKSTLVEAIAQGIPYTGDIWLEGRAIRTLRATERARKIGVLSQNNTVEYDYSVEEIVRLGRYAHAPRRFLKGAADDREAIDRALCETGLEKLRHANVRTLSGGELQRTFLAQVFAQNPALLILDEPANHLDLVYQKHIFSLVQQWLRIPGRAVISVVHDVSLAQKYGTHALLLREGRCLAQGTIQTVFTPETLASGYGMDVYRWMQDMLALWRASDP